MHANIQTVAFRGIDTIAVDVQIHIANGLPAMAIVGLADKSVAESKERVRAALTSIGLSLPPKRIAINLAPADVLKEGAHFDLPIALGLLVAMAALVGGGMRAKPGEISLAHHGVLFLDELAEFSRVVLDSLRQPLETGKVVVARANNNYTYPAQFQLVAAMNPCRCGYLGDPARACSRAPECGRQYCAKVSGPVMDRFDLIIEVPEVTPDMLMADNAAESSADIFDRIMTARSVAMARASQADGTLNAKLAGDDLDSAIKLENAARDLLEAALEQQQLSARAYHKIMRVARTIADLDDNPEVTRAHLAEALAYRAMPLFA